MFDLKYWRFEWRAIFFNQYFYKFSGFFCREGKSKRNKIELKTHITVGQPRCMRLIRISYQRRCRLASINCTMHMYVSFTASHWPTITSKLIKWLLLLSTSPRWKRSPIWHGMQYRLTDDSAPGLYWNRYSEGAVAVAVQSRTMQNAQAISSCH